MMSEISEASSIYVDSVAFVENRAVVKTPGNMVNVDYDHHCHCDLCLVLCLVKVIIDSRHMPRMLTMSHQKSCEFYVF